MSSTLTKRTRELRRSVDAAEARSERLYEALDEWVEARYRQENPTTDAHWLLRAADERVARAEERLCELAGRAW